MLKKPLTFSTIQTPSSYPASQKRYFTGARTNLHVPYRQIALSPTHHRDRIEENPPLPFYDTSGRYTDANEHIDLARGLSDLRTSWIKERNDTEMLAGPSSEHVRRRETDLAASHLWFSSRCIARRASSGHNVSQMHYARKGLVTAEMEFVSLRESMSLEQLVEKPAYESLLHQHWGESFGARLFKPRCIRSLPHDRRCCTHGSSLAKCQTQSCRTVVHRACPHCQVIHGPAHLSNMRPGDLLLEIEGTPVAPPDMPAFRMGGFSNVLIERLTGERVPLPLGIPMPQSKWHPIIRPKLVSWYKPGPGIGVLKVTGFPGQVGIDVAREIDEAVANLQDCSRLIVDLRGNPGGGAGGLRLMGYFTPDKLPVGYSLSKQRVAKGYTREELPRFDKIPSRKIALIPLLFRFALGDKSILMVTEGLGPQPFHGWIVLLVNQHTASAGETITGFAKENKLATIVGTTTAGQVLGGTGFKMGHGFVLRLPVVSFRTWGGTNLEGTGTVPDHPVDLSREALREGCDNQLEEAMRVVKSL